MELRRYWEIIWRRRWILIQAVILIPLFAYILMKVIPPIYQSQAKLWIKINTLQQKFIKDIPADVGKFEFTDKDNVMHTIEELLESRTVVSQVIRGMDIRDKKGYFLKEEDFIDPKKISLILRQKKGVDIDQIGGSETFKVIGYSNNPSEAKEIAERVIRAFLGTFSKMYKEEAKKAKKVIESRLLDLKKRLREAEQAKEDYRTGNKLFNIDTQISTLIKEISELESTRNTALRSLQENKLSVETIKDASMGNQQEFKDVQITIEDNAVVENYKKQLLELETELAKLAVERTSEHPDVKVVENRIGVVKEAIKNEMSKSFASQVTGRTKFYDKLTEKYSDAVIEMVRLEARERILTEQIKERQKRLDEIPGKERKLIEISREVDDLKDAYNSLISNLETTKSAEEMDLSNVFVIQPPSLSENPNDNLYFPPRRKKVFLAVATLMGVLFGTFLVFLLEYLDDSIWSSQEIEKNLNQKVIAVIPKVRRKKLDIEKIENSSLLDSVYTLIVNIKLFKCGEFGRVISIVSPMRGEGKSVLAVFVAGILAHQDKKTLLIDGNLRHPVLCNTFDLSNEIGLGNYLSADIKIQEMISSTFINNLDVITSGSVTIANPQRYLDSDKFSGLIKTLMAKYDIILLDTPAFVDGSDALIISKHAEDVLFVVEQGKTPQKKVKNFIEAINMAKMKVLGVVLNKVKYL